MTAAGPWLPRSDRTEMGPLSEEHRPRICAPRRWSARPSLTQTGPRPMRRIACLGATTSRRQSAINTLQLPLRYLDGAFCILSSGAVIREHVDQHKIGEGACCFLADRPQSADCE